MRVHSDILTEHHIIRALEIAKERGGTGQAVGFAALTPHGSRKRAAAYEVQLGSSESASFESAGSAGAWYAPAALKRSRRRHVRQWGNQNTELPYAPTWHEWGHFIAELFAVDAHAIVGQYDERDSFEYQTGWDRDYRQVDWAQDFNGRAYDFMADAVGQA